MASVAALAEPSAAHNTLADHTRYKRIFPERSLGCNGTCCVRHVGYGNSWRGQTASQVVNADVGSTRADHWIML